MKNLIYLVVAGTLLVASCDSPANKNSDKSKQDSIIEAESIKMADSIRMEDSIIRASPITDLEGKLYQTIIIGQQEWTVENLATSKYRNGEPIPEAKTNAEWEDCYANQKGAWCYYSNDPSNSKKYGKLYNWYAVNDKRGLAPRGTHVPSNQEWQTLTTTLGEEVAFSKLKESTGFNAHPAGERYYKDCSFLKKGEIGFWWSSSNEDTYNAWYFAMHFGLSQFTRDNGGMNTGFSIRCIKN